MEDVINERETLTMGQQADRLRDDLTDQIAKVDRIRDLLNQAGAQRSGLESMLGEALEEAEEHLRSRPYGIGTKVVVNVELYGGGPAGGVEFEAERGKYGLEWTSARCWHNDWFQERGWSVLDEAAADTLWEVWGLEYAMGFDE